MATKLKSENKLISVIVDGQVTYPGLAAQIFEDGVYGQRIKKRLQRLILDHPTGLSETGHDWYFGYLVCAYTQTHFGIKNLRNYPTVTKEIFARCLDTYS